MYISPPPPAAASASASAFVRSFFRLVLVVVVVAVVHFYLFCKTSSLNLKQNSRHVKLIFIYFIYTKKKQDEEKKIHNRN